MAFVASPMHIARHHHNKVALFLPPQIQSTPERKKWNPSREQNPGHLPPDTAIVRIVNSTYTSEASHAIDRLRHRHRHDHCTHAPARPCGNGHRTIGR